MKRSGELSSMSDPSEQVRERKVGGNELRYPFAAATGFIGGLVVIEAWRRVGLRSPQQPHRAAIPPQMNNVQEALRTSTITPRHSVVISVGAL
jgi:hypothetical protein